MAETFGTFADRLARLEGQLSGAPLKRAMDGIGMAAKKVATEEASGDLGGDPAFSGWQTKAKTPIPLDTRYKHVDEGKILFTPTPRAAGPWTVAEFGRNSTAGPRMVGPRLTKTGRVSKARQKRWNGTTQGKGTASRVLLQVDRLTESAADRHVKTVLSKFWA